VRLLFVYRFCGLGGVETSVLNKLAALESQGIEGHVLFCEFYGEGGRTLAAHPRVTVGLTPEDRLMILRTAFDAISVIDHPDFLDTLVSGGIPSKVLVESHASFLPALKRFYSRLDHPLVEAIIVPSQHNKRLIEKLASPSKAVFVIPNAIDTRAFRLRTRGEVEVAFPGMLDEPLIVWIGRLEDEKNPAEFVTIAQRILEAGVRARFMIVGDTYNYAEYRERLERLIGPDVRRCFTIHRWIPYGDMPNLYSLAALSGGCLVSTSRYESQPMVFLEAMACACPVVSTDVGGVCEVLTDGITGRLYTADDTEGGARAVVELMQAGNGSKRDEIVKSALGRVVDENSPERVGQLYRAVLECIGVCGYPSGQARLAKAILASWAKGLWGRIERASRWGRPARAHPPVTRGLVSTIIPVYNRPGLLLEAVGSVLYQTYPLKEIVIVDDGSTDSTPAVCDDLARKHPEITVVHQNHTGRAGLARETGRLLARGEYIQYLDSDDILSPRKFEVMTEALRENPECDIAYCCTRRYQRGDTPQDIPWELTGETFETMFPAFLSRRYWHTSTPLYRRRLCDAAGPWSDFLFWEDVEYDMRIAALGPRLYHCRMFLADSRDHDLGRLSKPGFYNDPELLRHVPRAYRDIYSHAKRYGLGPRDEAMQFFLEEVLLISRRCGELGLSQDAEACMEIVRDALGETEASLRGEFTVRATVQPERLELRAKPAEQVRLPVRVVNESTIAFRYGEFPFGLSYHLLSENGAVLQFDNPRSYFKAPLRPGEERVVELEIRAPEKAGGYALELDIVWETITWLKNRGGATSIVGLRVDDESPEGPRVGPAAPR
jgi:glycosyltransferase involved in cell wall biosynthesis